MWKKKYLPLTVEQKERGVIFSSALVRENETESDRIHEVTGTMTDAEERIERLKNVSFFKAMARDMQWSVTEIIRS